MGINVCATLGGNTGNPPCDVRMARPKYLLLSTSKEFTSGDIQDSASFKVALQAAMQLGNSDANKVYAFPEGRDITDNTGDPTEGSLADGYQEVLNEALPKYLIKSTPGTCVQQIMASFNGWPGKMFIVDANQILWFVQQADGGAVGFSVGSLYTNPPKFKGSTEVNTANTRIVFGSIDEFKSNVGAIKLDFNVKSLTNVIDVVLDDRTSGDASGPVSNVFVIGGKILCDGTDIYAAYSAGLNATTKWRSYKADGTPISITTVTLNAGLSGWNVTIDSVAFAALASGDVFYIDLQTPTVLAAAGIIGIEATKLRFAKF